MSFVAGETLRLTFATRVDEALVDPETVSLVLKPPSGASQTIAPSRLSLGRFRAQFAVSVAGTWRYRIESTGQAAGVKEGVFTVDPSRVLP